MAGIHKKVAPTIGISVDPRRRNRLRGVRAGQCAAAQGVLLKLICSPGSPRPPGRGDSSAEELKLATQLTGPVMLIRTSIRRRKPRSSQRKNFKAFASLRMAVPTPSSLSIQAKSQGSTEQDVERKK